MHRESFSAILINDSRHRSVVLKFFYSSARTLLGLNIDQNSKELKSYARFCNQGVGTINKVEASSQ